ncbi:hypothetical protein AOLI_G00303300 [Acnodon oligacanthus]
MEQAPLFGLKTPLSSVVVVLALCLGSLSCWKVNLRPSLTSFAESNKFSSKIALYLAPSIFPSTLTNFPVPAEEKQPQSRMLPPPYLTPDEAGRARRRVRNKIQTRKKEGMMAAALRACLCSIYQACYPFLVPGEKIRLAMKRPHDYSSPDSDTDELIDVGQEDSYCPVTGSMSPGSTSQILARKKRRGDLLVALATKKDIRAWLKFANEYLGKDQESCYVQIIEKRRRDRINHSLSELRRLVPSAFEKQARLIFFTSNQGSSKLEKAEILQMTVDHLKLLHAVGGKGYFDARALAVDYWTLGFRECVGEVVRYLSSLEGMESTDPIGVRLVSHLSHCASELDPLHQSSAALPFTPWPWGSFPQLSNPSSPTVPSPPFASDGRRDLTPHAALLAYPSPALRMAPLGSQGALLSPAISLVRRLPSVPSRPHRLPEPPQEGPGAPTSLHSAPPPRSSSSPSSISSSSSPTSSSASHPQVSFRPFAALGSPAPVLRGMGGSSKRVMGMVQGGVGRRGKRSGCWLSSCTTERKQGIMLWWDSVSVRTEVWVHRAAWGRMSGMLDPNSYLNAANGKLPVVKEKNWQSGSLVHTFWHSS